ncbi:hypothetical protein MBLNU230_g5004t1 [Neophaeotheca triangularis]
MKSYHAIAIAALPLAIRAQQTPYGSQNDGDVEINTLTGLTETVQIVSLDPNSTPAPVPGTATSIVLAKAPEQAPTSDANTIISVGDNGRIYTSLVPLTAAYSEPLPKTGIIVNEVGSGDRASTRVYTTLDYGSPVVNSPRPDYTTVITGSFEPLPDFTPVTTTATQLTFETLYTGTASVMTTAEIPGLPYSDPVVTNTILTPSATISINVLTTPLETVNVETNDGIATATHYTNISIATGSPDPVAFEGGAAKSGVVGGVVAVVAVVVGLIAL